MTDHKPGYIQVSCWISPQTYARMQRFMQKYQLSKAELAKRMLEQSGDAQYGYILKPKAKP